MQLCAAVLLSLSFGALASLAGAPGHAEPAGHLAVRQVHALPRAPYLHGSGSRRPSSSPFIPSAFSSGGGRGRAVKRDTLLPAQAPGVHNSLGRGQDPAPIAVFLNDTKQYVFPDNDFGSHVYLRISPSLDNIQRDASTLHTIYTFSSSIGTEAPDLCTYGTGYALYVSATSDNTMRVLTTRTDDLLGQWDDLGPLKDGHGQKMYGYDPHVIIHPSGQRYITWSNHSSVLIARLTGPATIQGNPVSLRSEGINTEAPSSVLLSCTASNCTTPQTLNLAFAVRIFDETDYATRVIYQSLHGDPLDPAQWKEVHTDVLSSDPSIDVYGPGSGGFFQGPDNTPWFAYGAFTNPNGFHEAPNNRTVRVQKVESDDYGVWRPTHVIAAQLDI